MVDKDRTKIFWTTKKLIILVISLIVIVLIGIYAIAILLQPPTFEDNLIKAHESGASPNTLISSIEAQDTAEKRLLNASANAGTALANYDFDQNLTSATEKENKINTINSNYQKEIGYENDLTTFRIAYVNGQISAEELKQLTEKVYQQFNNIKT